MKNRIFTQLGKKISLLLLVLFIGHSVWAQSTGDFRSIASGNWNTTTTWETYDGAIWSAASSTPTSTNNVYLQAGFTVTLAQNEACNDLYINNGAGNRIAISTFILEISGKLVSYSSGAGVFPITPSSTVGSSCISSTDGVGKMKFIGTTRTITTTGEWGNNPQGWDVEFAPAVGNTLSIQTGFKARNITVSSGTVTTSSADFRPDGAAAGTGTLTVKSGATLQFSGASANIKRVGTANATSHFGTLTVESGAILDFSGTSSPAIGTAIFDFSGTVKYGGAGAQTLATKGANSGGSDPNTYSNLYLDGSGAKTLGVNTTVNGTSTIAGTATLGLGAFTLTYGAASTLEYAGSAAQTTTTSEFPSSGVNNLIINNTNGVTIDAAKSISGNSTLYPLTSLTIDAAGSLSVTGNFLIQSDATGTGSLIDNGLLSVTGTKTMQNYLTGSGGAIPNGRYWYVGSPVASALSGVFNAMGDNKLWYWTETTAAYSEIALNGISLNPMQGFVARLGATETVNFTGGNFNTGTIGTLDNLTRTATGTYDGYNLVSNPYPSAINFDIAGTGLTRTNLYTTIWYRSNGVYPTYNFSSGATANGGQSYIPAMQAFWVLVDVGNTTGTLIMDNTSRVHNSQAFYKESSESNLFRMTVSNGTASDETVVGFYPAALETQENYDSYKMFASGEDNPQIYTLTSDDAKVIINGLPELTASDERIVPLGLQTNVAGTFSLNATNLDVFDATIPVYLEDVQENVTLDLRQTNTYSFSSDIVYNADRFKLHFGGITTGISTPEISSVYTYTFNKTVYVNTSDANATIEMYDLLGNLIMSKKSVSGLNVLQANVTNGIYIVKVVNGTNVITEKVMIN